MIDQVSVKASETTRSVMGDYVNQDIKSFANLPNSALSKSVFLDKVNKSEVKSKKFDLSKVRMSTHS